MMVCSCTNLPFNCWLQILFCLCINETMLFSFLWSLLHENGRSLRFPKIFLKKQTWWLNDKTIIEIGYRKISWFVSVLQINKNTFNLRFIFNNYQLLDEIEQNIVICQWRELLATDKSRYFAQPGSIIIGNYKTIRLYIKKHPMY